MSLSLSKYEETLRGMLGEDWFDFVRLEINKDYFVALAKKVSKERRGYTVYPNSPDVFKAFKLTPLKSLRVIILGQDPYHDGNASGLAFGSTNNNPNLQKIMKQLDFYAEFGEFEMNIGREPSLEYLAKQGVLLINRVLTVRRRVARSHSGYGWERFTAYVLQKISRTQGGKVFMLWGKDAQEVSKYLDPNGNLILMAEHPAAACYAKRPWHDMRCFTEANEYLKGLNQQIIKW